MCRPHLAASAKTALLGSSYGFVRVPGREPNRHAERPWLSAPFGRNRPLRTNIPDRQSRVVQPLRIPLRTGAPPYDGSMPSRPQPKRAHKSKLQRRLTLSIHAFYILCFVKIHSRPTGETIKPIIVKAILKRKCRRQIVANRLNRKRIFRCFHTLFWRVQ